MMMWIQEFWQRKTMLHRLGLPLMWCFQIVVSVRRWWLTRYCAYRAPVPVIVVGNLTTGGVGKTPLVIAMVESLQKEGYRVGVVSRGYKARLNRDPYRVDVKDTPDDVGDEPLLIAQKTGVPVVIARHRAKAAAYLCSQAHVDVIVSDDGLQHYRLARDIEIVVIDGLRQLGNAYCLPIGPLRESRHRLKTVDMCVVNEGDWPNAYRMTCQVTGLKSVAHHAVVPTSRLNASWTAVAGIGHPERFFKTLAAWHVSPPKTRIFPDHHRFQLADFKTCDGIVVMTEKDAIKCRLFAQETWYYLDIKAILPSDFWNALRMNLNQCATLRMIHVVDDVRLESEIL